MMPPPQVVGVLLKKPGQQTHPRLPPLDPQETKIRGKSHLSCLFCCQRKSACWLMQDSPRTKRILLRDSPTRASSECNDSVRLRSLLSSPVFHAQPAACMKTASGKTRGIRYALHIVLPNRAPLSSKRDAKFPKLEPDESDSSCAAERHHGDAAALHLSTNGERCELSFLGGCEGSRMVPALYIS